MTATSRVLGRRLRTQRLASAPLPTAAEVVRLFGAVQCQERDQALHSLGLRTRRATYASVLAELDAGAFVRTHVLRPTWHFVPAEDVRWMLALTGPRIERSLAARHRQLGLDDPRSLDSTVDLVCRLLVDRNFLTRKEISAALNAARVRRGDGSWLGHVLLVAEVRGLICSGPSRAGEHAYALLDEVVAPRNPIDDPIRLLVERFFLGHGPASIKDFVRWSGLTGKETTAALAEIDGLERLEVAGTTLWGDPDVPRSSPAARRALLLPTYDEATLTYPDLPFPIVDAHPMTDTPGPYLGDWSYGTILADGVNIGAWKPHWRKDSTVIRTRLSPRCDDAQRARVATAVADTARFLARDVEHLVEQ